MKLFEDARTYRPRAIRETLGISARALGVLLTKNQVPRIVMTKRLILFAGAELNAMIERRTSTPAARRSPVREGSTW